MNLLVAVAVTLPMLGQVAPERILTADKEPGNWMTYSGNYSAHRYSALDQINDTTVARLKPIWQYQTGSLQKFETTPLVIDNVKDSIRSAPGR
jgi:glucose dehydrogenase